MDHVTLQNIHLYDYDLPLARPLSIDGERVDCRKGVILHVISSDGDMGFGEAAPLPGLSVEPLKKAVHQLSRLQEELRGARVPLNRDPLLEWLNQRLDRDLFCASVCFAVESAVLGMAAGRAGMCLGEYLFSKAPGVVRSTGLLQGSPAEIMDQSRDLKARGCTHFKLKVGSRNIPLDVQKVENLKELLGPDTRIRLDANARWTREEAIVFGQSIGKNQIEFLEDPCQDVLLWEDIYRRTDIPLAVDEPLKRCSLDMLGELQGLSAFVVKPMVWGGVQGFLRVLRHARASGQKVIVSAAFESGVGINILANLAMATGKPAGLGTSAWLAKDLLHTPMVNAPDLVLPVENLCFSSAMFQEEFASCLKAV